MRFSLSINFLRSSSFLLSSEGFSLLSCPESEPDELDMPEEESSSLSLESLISTYLTLDSSFAGVSLTEIDWDGTLILAYSGSYFFCSVFYDGLIYSVGNFCATCSYFAS